MADDNQTSDSSTDTDETSDQSTTDNTSTDETSDETQSQDQTTDTDTTTGDETSTDSTDSESKDSAPDRASQALKADLHGERKKRQAAEAKISELEPKVAELETVKETLDAVQRKYDRLEAFVLGVGPIGKALDSKSFTNELFESDKDIEDIIKDWTRENPSATSVALGGGSVHGGGGKIDPNKLIRAAFGGGSK